MKKTLYLVLLLLFTFGATAQQRPRVGVVLSGGGAKGMAHIGALKVIEEAGYPVDIIAGTSMGSLIGALYSIGYSTDDLDSLVRSQDWVTLFTDRTDPSTLTLRQREEQNTYAFIRGLSSQTPDRGGLIRGRNLNRLFMQLCHYYLDSISFDSLPIPFACVATDIVTNTEVDFHSGSLVRAMRASMAIPGVFTPVRWGDSVLVDGGLQNNYPADLARAMGADIIIGVSVQSPEAKADDLTDAGSVMNQIININCKKKYTENVALSDIFIQVDVSGYGAASFTPSAIDTLIRRGGEAARRQWDDLLQLRRSHHIDSTTPRKQLIHPAPPNTDGRPTNTPSRIPVASVGFRFDTEEMGAIQLNGKLPLPTSFPMGLQGTVRLGRRNLARLEATLLTHTTGFNPTLAYTFRNNDLDIYAKGTRNYNIRYRQHTVDFIPFDMRLRLYDLKAGVRWDYYNYYGHLLAADGNTPTLDDDHFISYYLRADLNTENNWYFPTKGNRFHASYAYHTSNFYNYNGHPGFSDILAHWRINIPLGDYLAMQSMLYGRLLLGREFPLAFSSAMGGNTFGHYVEQQVPFAGLGHVELTDRYMAAWQVQMQWNPATNHYVLLRLAGGYHANSFNSFNIDGLLAGIEAAYSYSTFFGPLGASLGYSTLSQEPYFFINIGHIF